MRSNTLPFIDTQQSSAALCSLISFAVYHFVFVVGVVGVGVGVGVGFVDEDSSLLVIIDYLCSNVGG